MTSIILWTLLAIDIVLVIMALVKVLLEELQPFKAMFWVMTIIFVPILGLVLFFFFGKNLHKKRLLSDRTHMLIAERIYQYDEVESMYLMSGSFDLTVIISGRSLREVAQFVGERLAPLEGVTGTATHFILKKYKEKHLIFRPQEPQEREYIFV